MHKVVVMQQVTTSYMKMVSSYVMQLFPMLDFDTFMFAPRLDSLRPFSGPKRSHSRAPRPIGLQVSLSLTHTHIYSIICHTHLCRVQYTLIAVRRGGERVCVARGGGSSKGFYSDTQIPNSHYYSSIGIRQD